MAVISKYDNWNKRALDGSAFIDWDTDSIKVALTSSVYVPSTLAHLWFSDITNEVSGTNYTAGGSVIPNRSVTLSSGTSIVNGDDVVFLQNAAGFSNARYGIIYKDTGVSSTSPLIGYINFITDQDNVNGNFTIQWNATGIFTQV